MKVTLGALMCVVVLLFVLKNAPMYSFTWNPDDEYFADSNDTAYDLQRLPNLTSLRWPNYRRPKHIPNITKDSFGVALSRQNMEIFHALMEVIRGVMVDLGLNDQWFLTGGSLIG